MVRIRTLQLNGELVDHIEMLYKGGRTWNDVVAHILGYEDFKDFCEKNSVIKQTKKCNDTIDMFGEEDETCI